MKISVIVMVELFFLLFFSNQISAQKGIRSITTNASNIATSPLISGRKGAGVQSMNAGLENRWDSMGTNFNIQFNAGNADIISVTDIRIDGVGVGLRLPLTGAAKVRRVANAMITNDAAYFPYFAVVDAAPLPIETVGTFLVNAPEVTSIESGLISNNINTGYDNIFQNSNDNVHYGNVERIDYIFPNGFTPEVGVDLRKIGFTVYDAGEDGNAFKLAGIKTVNNFNDPSGYTLPLVAVLPSAYGEKLLQTFKDFAIFQKDPNRNSSESRPSIVVNQNMRGTFISLADLGFSDGQTVFGFSIFANDIPDASNEAYLLNFNNFPTNSNSNDMLDLVNSIGAYSFSQNIVLATGPVLVAAEQNAKVFLKWNTSTFNDAQKVYLQRANKNMNYINITEVSNGQLSFIDEAVRNGDTYYRLKIISTSGTEKYSNIQFIRSKNNSVQVFPTVTNNLLYVSSNALLINKPVFFTIVDLQGKLVQSLSKNGNRNFNIDVSNLENAMYIISVMQNNEVITRQKFIKQ